MSDTTGYLERYRPRLNQACANDLCVAVPSVTTDETNEKVLELFSKHRDLTGLPVIEGTRPIGLINRNIFLSQMSKQFRMELYGRKSCIAFMDKEPLVVDAGMDIEALTFRTVAYGEKAFTDGFIITRDEAFVGMATGLQLMRAIAEMQAARNRQVMHSIEYASVIQQSTLRSSREALNRASDDASLVWEPRDVVGGDFYQFSMYERGWFATVADCTGHGVPGAFMTLIASTSLNKALEQHGADDPGALLASVNNSIKLMLGQVNGSDDTPGSDDGMDAASFWFEPATGRMIFAGARLGLFIMRPDDTDVDVVDGQRMGIGYVDSQSDFVWTNHALDLPKGSVVFVTTDGLIDQVGGTRGIAFGKRRIRAVLMECRNSSASEINTSMSDALRVWQGQHSRRDDLTFFCFRT